MFSSLNIFYLPIKQTKWIRHKLNKLMKSSPCQSTLFSRTAAILIGGSGLSDTIKDHPSQLLLNLVRRFQRRFKCDLLIKNIPNLNIKSV